MNMRLVLTQIQKIVHRMVDAEIVGMDIGDTQIKVAQMSYDQGKYSLQNAFIHEIGEGGQVNALKAMMQTGEVAAKDVALALASPEAVVRPFEFPQMPRNELKSAIQLEAESAILNGHLPHQIVINWHALPSRIPDFVRGILAVVPKDIVETRLKTIKKAGLNPVVVDIKGLALWNAFSKLAGEAADCGKPVLLLNLNSKSTNLVIAKFPDELLLARDLEVGHEAFSQGRQEDWFSEIHDSMMYAHTKGSLKGIKAGYVTGSGAEISIVEKLNRKMPVPMRIWNPLSLLVSGKKISDLSIGPCLAVAMGLAMRRAW